VHEAQERHAVQRVAPLRAAPERPLDVTEEALPDAPSHCEAERLRAAVPPDAAQAGCDSVQADCDSLQAEADAQQVRCGSVQADLREAPERAVSLEGSQPEYSAFPVELPQAYAAFHAEPGRERYCALPAGSPDEEQRRCSHALADAARCSDELPCSRSDARFRSGAEYWLCAHLDAEHCSGAAAWPAS
jgi:hypothetical protein